MDIQAGLMTTIESLIAHKDLVIALSAPVVALIAAASKGFRGWFGRLWGFIRNAIVLIWSKVAAKRQKRVLEERAQKAIDLMLDNPVYTPGLLILSKIFLGAIERNINFGGYFETAHYRALKVFEEAELLTYRVSNAISVRLEETDTLRQQMRAHPKLRARLFPNSLDSAR